MRAWWKDHGFGDHPASVGKRVAVALLEQRMIPHKLAGVLVLQELGEQLRAADLTGFARLFESGHLADQEVVDPFATKVLGALLERESSRHEVAYTLATWRTGQTIWQRRSACLAFMKLAADENADVWEAILTICSTVVWSHERLDQTAVGSVLRELSRAEPERVEAFFRRYALLMSKECARTSVAKFPTARRALLLAHHRRATALRIMR